MWNGKLQVDMWSPVPGIEADDELTWLDSCPMVINHAITKEYSVGIFGLVGRLNTYL